jgi:DNA replication ATP-dependent helicase Dna2
VDNQNNFIVLHPDHLISATVVADSFSCSRRAVLQDRVKAHSEASKPQVYGHILHEIFQEALKTNEWDLETLGRYIEELLVKYVESLFEIQISMAEAAEYLKSKMPAMKAWAETFVRVKPSVSYFASYPYHASFINGSSRKLRWWKIKMTPRHGCPSISFLK